MTVNSAVVDRTGGLCRNILITDNGPFESMAYNGDFSEEGTAVICGMNNSEITNVTILRSYYHGISCVSGSNIDIHDNYIVHPGVYTSDGGGIYTIGSAKAGTIPIYSNRQSRNNIIDSATAWVYGYSPVPSKGFKGIYDDSRAHNWTHYNNLILNADIGIANNNPDGITLRDNTIIATRPINFTRRKYAVLNDFKVRNNLIPALSSSSINIWYYTDSIGSMTIAQDFSGKVSIDSNIYITNNFQTQTEKSNVPVTYILSSWRTATGVSFKDTVVSFVPISETGLKVIYNWTASPKTYTLAYKYKDFYGRSFTNGSIVLNSKKWIVLKYDGPLDIVVSTPGLKEIKVPWIFKL